MTILNRGDVAVVGYDYTNVSSFSVVFLRDVDTAHAISFTDNSIDNNEHLGTYFEGNFNWTPPVAIAAGSVVTFSETASEGVLNVFINGTAAGQVTSNPIGTGTPNAPFWSLSAAGDQIVVYQGSPGNQSAKEVPNYLFALHLGDNGTSVSENTDPEGDWDDEPPGNGGSSSHRPSALNPNENGGTSYSVGFYDNDLAADVKSAGTFNIAAFSGSASAQTWMQRITDPNNWVFADFITTAAGANSFSSTAFSIAAPTSPPVISANNGSTVLEGGVDVITPAELAATDSDTPAGTLVFTVTSTAPTRGSLWVDADNNGEINGSEAALGVGGTFTQSQIQNGLVKYRHDGSETTIDSFGFTVTDGQNTTAPASFTLIVTPVNDAPTISGLNGDSRTWSEAVNLPVNIDALVDATITDPDSANFNGGSIQVTVSNNPNPAEDRFLVGTVGNIASNGSVVTFAGDVIATVSGDTAPFVITFTSAAATPSVVQEVLRAIRYTNIGGDAVQDRVATLQVTVSDGDGGTSQASAVTLTIVAQNDPPTLTGLPASLTVTEDTATDLDLSAVTLGDPDSASLTLTLAASSGTLSATSGGGVTVGGSGTGTLTLTGSPGAIDTFLNTATAIRYLGAADVAGPGAATLSVSVDDSGTVTSFGSVTIDITAVDDAPVQAVNAGLTVDEGGTATIGADRLSATDPDTAASARVYTLTDISALAGTLWIDADTNGTLDGAETALGVGGTFTQADIDAGLLAYAHDGSETGGSFGFTLGDGTTTLPAATFAITRNAVNDAPAVVILAPTTATEDSPGGLTGFAISDPDAGSGTMQVLLQVHRGTLTATTGSGVTVVGGGAAFLSLYGTVTNINAFIAASGVTYATLPDDDGDVSLTVTVLDNGNTGSGGGKQTSQAIVIDVTPQDDPASAIDDAFALSDTGSVSGDLFAANPGTADSDPDGSLTVTAVNGVGAGVGAAVTLASGARVTVQADGTFTYDTNGAFEYLPVGATGTDSFTYTLNGDSTATVTLTLTGQDNRDRITGTAANDTLSGGLLGDTLEGGDGVDLLDYRGSADGVTVDIGANTASGGDAEGDVISGFESVFGSRNADNLTGADGGGWLHGWQGNDTLTGGNGRDRIEGQDGDDVLTGGEGTDFLFGGIGNDTYRVTFATDGNDRLRETQGIDTLIALDSTAAGLDLRRSGQWLVLEKAGTTGKVVIEDHFAPGGTRIEFLQGTDRTVVLSQSLTGSSADELIVGTSAAETLTGGGGDDVLTGGGDKDVLRGGLGADVFDYNAIDHSSVVAAKRDTIMDFSQAEGDRIDLSSLDANVLLPGNDAFVFLGSGLTAGAGTLAFRILGGNTLIEADVNGGGADFAILLAGSITLTATDFIL